MSLSGAIHSTTVLDAFPRSRKRKVFRFTRRTRRTCRLGQVRQIDGWGEDLRCDHAVALFAREDFFENSRRSCRICHLAELRRETGRTVFEAFNQWGVLRPRKRKVFRFTCRTRRIRHPGPKDKKLSAYRQSRFLNGDMVWGAICTTCPS